MWWCDLIRDVVAVWFLSEAYVDGRQRSGLLFWVKVCNMDGEALGQAIASKVLNISFLVE